MFQEIEPSTQLSWTHCPFPASSLTACEESAGAGHRKSGPWERYGSGRASPVGYHSNIEPSDHMAEFHIKYLTTHRPDQQSCLEVVLLQYPFFIYG